MSKKHPTARHADKPLPFPKPVEPDNEMLRALSAIASFSLDGETVDDELYTMTEYDAFDSIYCVVNIARDALNSIGKRT